MRRLLPSHPDFERIDDLALTIAYLSNPHVHWNLRELDEVARLNTLDRALRELEGWLSPCSVFFVYALEGDDDD